ncbi:MAG: TldD/PmbA family protein, partial [Actinobacteria bacterium]|nr:TldD/PmbA family protein [Actinomycetota bacterium]
LATYLHTTWTAQRVGDGARSTGNAARAGYQSSPGVSPTNLHLVPGGRSAGEVIAMVDDGVYVQDVMGLHSGANPISGEFSVSFTGLAIRDGQLAEPIREAAVSSTIVDILRGVRAVATDLRFYPFAGSLGGTTTLVAEMSVSGE